jgi:hypothetical protein
MLTHLFDSKSGNLRTKVPGTDLDRRFPTLNFIEGSRDRRFLLTDLDNTQQDGDPLTDFAFGRGRPLVEQMIVEKGTRRGKSYRWGMPISWRDDATARLGSPRHADHPVLNMLELREYLFLFSDGTLEFLSRREVTELLDARPSICLKCHQGKITKPCGRVLHLYACESCWLVWHIPCAPSYCRDAGMFNRGEIIFCEPCHKVLLTR